MPVRDGNPSQNFLRQHQLIRDPEVYPQGLVYPFIAEETLIQLTLIRT